MSSRVRMQSYRVWMASPTSLISRSRSLMLPGRGRPSERGWLGPKIDVFGASRGNGVSPFGAAGDVVEDFAIVAVMG